MGIFSTIGNAITGPFRGIGNILQGKFGKGLAAFGDTLKVAAPVLGATGFGIPLAAGLGAAGGAMSSLDNPDTSFLEGTVGGGAMGAAGGVAGAPGMLPKIGSWLSKNAPLVTGIAGTAADVYGANKRSQEMDRQMAFQEEEARKNRRQNELAMLMNTMASMRPRY